MKRSKRWDRMVVWVWSAMASLKEQGVSVDWVVRRMRSWPRKIQGREFQAEGRVSTEPKVKGSLEAGAWPAGLGLGAKEWDSARLGVIFLDLLLHVRSSNFSPGKSTGVGCHFLLQRIFPTQGLNLGSPHCRQALYHLSHQGSQMNQRDCPYLFLILIKLLTCSIYCLLH